MYHLFVRSIAFVLHVDTFYSSRDVFQESEAMMSYPLLFLVLIKFCVGENGLN